MPSSNKTPYLSLNNWVGSDIPKREDFNADNTRLDEGIAALRQQVEALDTSSGGAGLAAHIADEAAHNAAPVIGSYTGDGNLFQGVTLGFRPRFGFVFASALPIVATNSGGTAPLAHLAALTRQGCTTGAETTSTGFKAYQSAGAGLNQSGVSYTYLMWR